jgi:hypothetical protein
MNTSPNITRRLIGLLVFCFVIQFAFAGPVFAQFNPVGTEFQINTHITNAQRYPSVTGLTGGGFVVTWQSDGQDGNGFGIYGQVFDNSGNMVGTEFRVNTYTTNEQADPSVAGLTGGGFVVTWQSDAQDGNGFGIYGQVFDNSGNMVGTEFRVNTYTTGWQCWPSVAGLAGGGFVVTWTSSDQDGNGFGIYGQIFDSAGTKVGSEFRVNTCTGGSQTGSLIAGLTGGGFVVTWNSDGQDGSGDGVYGQVFDSSGTKMGEEFRVNTYTNNGQSSSSVAGLTGGGFVVTWNSDGQDGSGDGVYGQRFSGGGGSGKHEVVLDFGQPFGLWHYAEERSAPWTQLNNVDPGLMIAVDIDNDGTDELVVSFRGHGLYTYDETKGWTLINTVIPQAGIPYRNGIGCDFGAAYGLWVWDQTGGWKQINTVNPKNMIAADIDRDGEDELVVSFIGWGLYIYDEVSGWTQINTEIPDAMIGVNLMN